MARRKRQQPKQPEQLTRKEYLRRHKDRRQQRALLAVVAPILVLVAMILGVGIYREVYLKGRVPVARVDGETITAAAFSKRIEYQRRQLINNVASLMQYASSTEPGTLNQLFENQRTSLPEQTVGLMIDEVLIRHEAKARGITVTDQDVTKEIDNSLATEIAPTPAPEATAEALAAADLAETAEATSTLTIDLAATPGFTMPLASLPITGTTGVTGTGALTGTSPIAGGGAITGTSAVSGTEAVSPTIPAAELEQAFKDKVQPILDQTGLTRQDYEDIIRQSLYRDRLSEALGAEVSITDKQVDAEYLLFESRDIAQQAVDAVKAGQSWSDAVEKYRPPATPTPEATEPQAAEEATEAPATPEALPTEAAAPSGGVTTTGQVTGTGAVTTTGQALTPEPTQAPPTATPAPTPTPNPYAIEVGQRDWHTQKGLVDSYGLSDTDAGTVMALQANEVSAPVSGGRGTYVFFVYGVDPERELSADELKTRKDGALDAWLEEVKKTAKIDQYPLEGLVPPEPAWFVNAWQQLVGVPEPTLDLSQLEVPTATGAAGGAPAVGVTVASP